MPYIVVEKLPDGTEYHATKGGNLTLYGKPYRFVSREKAKEVAQTWSQINANCRQPGKLFVRSV